MELFLSKKVGDVERSLSIEFDAKSCEDCAQAVFHSTSFFGGDYGIIKAPKRDITLDDIKQAFEKIKNAPDHPKTDDNP